MNVEQKLLNMLKEADGSEMLRMPEDTPGGEKEEMAREATEENGKGERMT